MAFTGSFCPIPLPTAAGDDWYIYYAWGETMFRRTRKERENLRLLILPESVEDWVELLRQALRETVFEVRYEVRPHFLNALGDVETVPLGYEFALSSCAPHTAAATAFRLSATADTPDGGRARSLPPLDGKPIGHANLQSDGRPLPPHASRD